MRAAKLNLHSTYSIKELTELKRQYFQQLRLNLTDLEQLELLFYQRYYPITLLTLKFIFS